MDGQVDNAASAGGALPLAGLRVLEFCHTVMGPTAGVLLADFGADVIKIEPAPLGDRTRNMRGFASGFFYAFNRNKRSLAIDLKSADGKQIIYKLAETADIVLENYGPGTMEKLGCGYDDLSRVNPRIIYCAMKGFLSGPYEHRPALDEVVQHMAGLAFMTGPPGRPLRAGASVVDMMGGMFGIIAVQAALRERDRTGKGQFIKSALFETTAFLMTQHMAGEAVTGKPSVPMNVKDKEHGAWAIYETFDTSDGEQIFIGLTSDGHWRRFWEYFDRPDMIEDPVYATNADRLQQLDVTRPLVQELVAGKTLAEMSALCDGADIPFAPVAEPGDLFDDPQLNAAGRMMEIDFPGGIHSKIPGLPVELEHHKLGIRNPAPKVGENSAELLAELGYGPDEIRAFTDDGVIVVPAPEPAPA